jgi:ABC-2 type transport system permease protein
MAFLAPLIMVVVFGGIVASHGGSPPAALRPLLAYGVGAMVLLMVGVQLLGNQFGYDRAGFRAYVLSPLPRRDILLGKNLAVAPLALGLALLGLVVAGSVYPMRVDHYPAVLAQLLSTYLLFCLVSNVMAILTPLPLAPGSLQPASVKAGPVLMQLLVLMVLPALVLPVLAPYGLEVLLDGLDLVKGVPIALPLSLVGLALVGLVYRWGIGWQGAWLAAREQSILEVVTSRAE